MEKDNFTGQKLITSTLAMLNLQTMIPIMKLIQFFNQELQCHCTTDFEFVYYFNRNMQ